MLSLFVVLSDKQLSFYLYTIIKQLCIVKYSVTTTSVEAM